MITVKCRKCTYVYRTYKTVWELMTDGDRCPCCGSTHIYAASAEYSDNDKTDYVNYSKEVLRDNQINFLQKQINIIKEDKNMKKQEEKTNNELMIRRDYTTERGIFTAEMLEATDMFVLIDDESQTVYMAINEGEPRFKTKTAVIEMKSGKLCYISNDTKIHVYRRNQTTLHVGEFKYPNMLLVSRKDYD